jgi:hypothetical protein
MARAHPSEAGRPVMRHAAGQAGVGACDNIVILNDTPSI